MKCPVCKINRKKKDFFGKKICYKCEYQRKIKEIKIVEVKKLCKLCSKVLPRGKWAYCTEECAGVAHLKQKRDYWTNKVKRVPCAHYVN